MGIFLYDVDLSDSDTPIDIALQYPVITYNAAGIIYSGFSDEVIIIPFANRIAFINRAPPA